jgi:DNA-binding IclR family transcriptional regulator
MVEIQMTDGTSQTFMMKASTNIVKHLLKEMRETGYLTMWNDTDVLCIRADQVKQFALRAFTQQEK